MSGTTDDADRVRPWIRLAEEDFSMAGHEMEREQDGALGGICFHSQQCVEKYLKALLVAHAVDFPKVHDLEAIMALIPGGAGLSLKVDDVLPLNRYATAGRYPGDWEMPTREEAAAALEMARKARDAVRKCLPKESLD